MASYTSLRHVTIGQYIPADSFVHRMDPRSKMIVVACLVVAAVVASTYSSALLILVLAVVLVKAARLSLGTTLASLVPVVPVLLIMAVLQILLYGGATRADVKNDLLVAWGPLHIYAISVRIIMITWARFATLFLSISLLTNTTTVSALTHGLEGVLRPFNAIGVPGHELAMVGAIAFRFLPILGEQLESILQAQASRGVSQSQRGRLRLAQNARRLANTVVPLFVDAYHRAEEMILAMQARCYRGGRGRTCLAEFTPRMTDHITSIAAFLLMALVIAMQFARLP